MPRRTLLILLAMAHAGQAEQLEQHTLEETLVTAQRKLESAQDTPISLSTFDAEDCR